MQWLDYTSPVGMTVPDRIIDLRKTPPAGGRVVQGNAGSSRGAQQRLDPHAFAFITCVNAEAQYAICLRHLNALQIPAGFSVEKIAVSGATSMAEGYQHAMETSTARYKIYMHQDVYVGHRGLLAELLHLFSTYPRLGLVGVIGATQLPVTGWWLDNPAHAYGRAWVYIRLASSLRGIPLSPAAYRRRLQLFRCRSFAGDYLPAVHVDGFLMATQYDIPWIHPQFGFELYDQVQALEFIKARLEVGIARQEASWCVHWGAPQEPTREEDAHRRIAIRDKAGMIRQLYPAFIGVPVSRLYERHRGAAGWPELVTREFAKGVPVQAGARDSESPDRARKRLGVIIVTFNGREVLFRALRVLLQQCEELEEVDCQFVVVDDASTDGTVEAVRREFPRVTVIANASNGGLARGLNLGLRHLGFPNYTLVMPNDVELSAGTLLRMVRYLREHPSTTSVVACPFDRDGTVQSQRTAIVELPPRLPRRSRLNDFVGPACVLVRGETFFDVGLYDERFHLCYVELDWSLRAKRKGYRFVFLPEARMIHHRSVALRRNKPAIVAKRLVDDLWLLYKYGGRRQAAVRYWAQRLLARWLAFQWRNDSEALRQLGDALARTDDLYRRLREENRPPRRL
jgi:GT2 family glycosyltransferase